MRTQVNSPSLPRGIWRALVELQASATWHRPLRTVSHLRILPIFVLSARWHFSAFRLGSSSPDQFPPDTPRCLLQAKERSQPRAAGDLGKVEPGWKGECVLMIVHPSGPKQEVSARSSGTERLLTRTGRATERTETLGHAKSTTRGPTADVARDRQRRRRHCQETHAQSHTVARTGQTRDSGNWSDLPLKSSLVTLGNFVCGGSK